jgi:hypothetical protein
MDSFKLVIFKELKGFLDKTALKPAAYCQRPVDFTRKRKLTVRVRKSRYIFHIFKHVGKLLLSSCGYVENSGLALLGRASYPYIYS